MEGIEHPLTVRPEVIQGQRVEQPVHESLRDLPARIALVAPTGFGKTQVAITIANALLPLMSRTHIFSATIDEDPSYKK